PTAELPVIADADGAEPTIAALCLMKAERSARHSVAGIRVRLPEAAAGAAEDVEAGPVIGWGNGRGRFSIGSSSQIGCRRGSSECHTCGQRDNQLLLFSSPRVVRPDNT